MRRVDAMASSAALMLLGLMIAFYAPQFDLGTLDAPGAGFMPFLAGVVIFASAAVGFAVALKEPGNEGKALWPMEGLLRQATVLAMVFGYAAFLDVGGFLCCAFLLVLTSMRVNSAESWRTSLTWAALIAGGSYVVFVVLLKVDLPRGVLQALPWMS